MVNWKLINKFVWVFGIVFIVFTILAGFINYEMDKLQYSSAAPMSFIDYSIISNDVAVPSRRCPFICGCSFSTQAAKSAEEKNQKARKKTQNQRLRNLNRRDTNLNFFIYFALFQKKDFFKNEVLNDLSSFASERINFNLENLPLF